MANSSAQRQFAVEVVQKLGAANFESYWAGGCVRDQQLGRTPKDYDVATTARPEQIRDLFGHRRTLAIRAAFGVITVLGQRPAGQIDVATFRRDGGYSDGRHPDGVTFSSAKEDATRRDFTINGMFFDPVAENVIDYVGGMDDLHRGVVRAIGDPLLRFQEDKLRMLRAVRFATTLGFDLDSATAEAIAIMSDEIGVVSAERIAEEMRRTLVSAGRTTAIRRLIDLGLAATVLPEAIPHCAGDEAALAEALSVLGKIEQPGFPLALAVLLSMRGDAQTAKDLGHRWRLANKEIDAAAWLLDHRDALTDAAAKPWSKLQPLLIHPWINDLISWHCAWSEKGAEEAAHCQSLRQMPPELLDPPPLVSGDDLIRAGLRAGKHFATILRVLRDGQLDGTIRTSSEAIAFAQAIVLETNK